MERVESAIVEGRVVRAVWFSGAFGAIFFALLGLVAYVPGLRLLGSLHEGYIPMAPSTAVSFLVLGIIVLLLRRRSWPRWAWLTAQVLAAATTLFGLLEILGAWLGRDLNLEDRLVPTAGKLGDIPVARMSPATGAGFVLAGLAVLCLLQQRRNRRALQWAGSAAGILGAAAIFVSVTILLGYLYGTPLMYGGGTVPMAVTTALGFGLLGHALCVASGVDSLPLRPLVESTTRAQLLRAFLPLTMLALLAQGLVSRLSPAVLGINHALLSALLAVLVAFATGLIITRVARRTSVSLDRAEQAKQAAMEALQEQERSYRALVETMADGLVVRDEQGKLSYVNDRICQLLGYQREELLGASWDRFFSEAEQERIAAQTQKREQGEQNSYEVVWTRKDGTPLHTLASAAPLYDADGQVKGSFAVVSDLSDRVAAEGERQRLEAQMRHVQKLESLGVLAGGIAHDFNNILVAILGNASLARTDVGPAHEAHHSLADIETAANRAADLCRQLLAYSGRSHVAVAPVSLSSLVQEMGSILRVSISKKAQLTYDLGAALPDVDADEAQLQQIVMNLIINASEALSGVSDEILVSTRARSADQVRAIAPDAIGECRQEAYVEFCVRDEGTGMDEATQERIFDPFYSTKFTGRGLGLAAVLGIVRAHGGLIDVTSAPGEGSTFRVFLPASKGDAVVTPERPPAAVTKQPDPELVLVVDDEEIVRATSQRVLLKAGFSIVEASDGAEGQERLDQHGDEICCVLLDMTMPRMDGAETLSALRKRYDVPVILTSGYTEQELSGRLGTEKRVTFLSKPFSPEQLLVAVQDALDQPL